MIKKSKKIMASVFMALSLLAIFTATNVFALDGPKLKENTVNPYFKYYTDYTLLKEDDPIRKSIENDPILREYRDYERFLKNQCIPTENDRIVYNPKDDKYYGIGLSQEYGFAKPSNSHVDKEYYASDDGSLVKDKWVLLTTTQGTTHWEYYGSDYKIKTGF